MKPSFTIGTRYRRTDWPRDHWIVAEWFNDWYLAGVDQGGRKRSFDHTEGAFVPWTPLKQYLVTCDDTSPLQEGDIWIGTKYIHPFVVDSASYMGATGYQKIVKIEEVPS